MNQPRLSRAVAAVPRDRDDDNGIEFILLAAANIAFLRYPAIYMITGLLNGITPRDASSGSFLIKGKFPD